MSVFCRSHSPLYAAENAAAAAGMQGAHPPAARRFLSPEEQTEPVDFSTANEPVNFSGSRLVALPPGYTYSRASTPESQQPYLEYRDNPAAAAAAAGTCILWYESEFFNKQRKARRSIKTYTQHLLQLR
jgi:hypothetical protein